MGNLHIINKNPILTECECKNTGIAFDGCYVYLCTGKCACISRYEWENMEYVNTFPTTRAYNSMCYDSCEECFWAVSDKCYSKIFKLNTCFKEVDCISVCTEKCGGIPVGIAYDCACDALLVAFADCILRVRKKECENVPIVVSTNSGTWNTGILAISPWYIRTFIKDCQQYMDIMDGNWCLKKRILLPCEYMIEDMILMPSCDCERRKTKCLVWMLATKANCYSYILEVVVDAGVEVYDCNYIECSEPRDECAISRRARNDVMESVALVETALSHILNAEGEKIQKILEVTNDVDKILDVNKAVNQTIVNASHLEHVLYDKLKIITECCECDEC